jgi:hypothetical protein
MPSPSLLLAADTLSLSNGDPVSTWTDGSGSSNNATGSGATRPTYQTNVVNSLPVVRFTTSSILLLANTISDGDCTIVCVLKESGSRLIALGGTGSWAFYGTSGGLWLFRADNDGGFTASVSYTGFNVWTSRVTSGVVSAWKNGVPIGSPTAVGTRTIDNIGTRQSLASTSDGDVAEIRYYSSALSEVDRSGAEQSVGTKYSITVTPYVPPAGHLQVPSNQAVMRAAVY